MEPESSIAPWLTPIAVAVVGGIFTLIGIANSRRQARLERQARLDAQLGDKRRELYSQILEPFVTMLAPDAVWQRDPRAKNKKLSKQQAVANVLLSMSYRETAFQLTFVAPDDVVRAYNEVQQHFYRLEERRQDDDALRALRLLGRLLLAIRKGAGNDTTRLDEYDMLEWWMKDARQFRLSDPARSGGAKRWLMKWRGQLSG